MEDCDSLGMLTVEDGTSFCESHADPPNSCESNMKTLSVNDLASCFSESLKVQSDRNSTSGITTTRKCSICFVNKDESNDCHVSEMVKYACKECIDSCATFPCSSKAVFSAGSAGCEEKKEVDITAQVSTQNVQENSANQPTRLKLVSALKGSREKQGKPTQKLSVKWSPDVYDPIPTASSHVVSNKYHHRHRSESKKNGKNKQKSNGKSSRSSSSSKGKEKKQTRKSSSSRSSSINWYDRSYLDNNNTMMVSSSESLPSIANYDVGSPDQFCGSSFLMTTSMTKMHFPVGEAS